MQIAVLGPLEVRDDEDRPVVVAGARLRTLLVALAVDAGRWVSTAALVDTVWSDDPPAEAANALQTLVSRLRRTLGGAVGVESSPAGYRLAVDTDDVDAALFTALVREADTARTAAAAEALDLLERALALWRGPALDGTVDGRLAVAATQLEQVRTRAQVSRAELALAAGKADADEIAALAAADPLDERLAVLAMRALAGVGRQAEALRAYESLRARLADELGVDPSAETKAAHLELLRGEQRAPEPAPSASPARRTNLRVPLTSFVGRDEEVERIRAMLCEHRLVTLVGPGGAGKTRLASEAARGLLPDSPDGVWLAELAAATSGADVAQVVLGSVGLRELHTADPAQGDAVSRLRAAFATKRLVLVLDNCEHVIDAAAELADSLLGECPGLSVVATSREPLGIAGETLFPVPPLGRPGASATPQEAARFPSVALFVDRAASVRPGFALDESTVGPIGQIVERLDGLPLAIELAAARLRSLPLDDIAERLSDRFRLLTGGSRTALPRHRTLRAVVEWSWDLLTDLERALVERLAVFPAGVTADSAASVRPETVPADDVPDLLASLVDKSLLQPIGDGRRLRMLETIREYGIERLAAMGALDEARDRHAKYFAAALSDLTPRLMTREQLPWLALLRAEQENVLAAMRHFIGRDDADSALRTAIDLSTFAMIAGSQSEAVGWVIEALSTPGGDERLRLVATALRIASTDFTGEGNNGIGEDELTDLARRLGEIETSFAPMLAMLRPGLAFVSRDMELAHRLLDEGMNSSDPWIRASSLLFSANIYENEGQVERTREQAERALAAFREIGERWGTSAALRSIAQLLTLGGELEAAAAAYAESMELARELSSEDDAVFLLGELADLAMRRGDLDAARGYLERATEQAEQVASDFESLFAWVQVAEMERWVGSWQRARELAEVGRSRLDSLPESNPMNFYIRSMLFDLLGKLALDEGDEPEAQRQAEASYGAAVRTRDLPVLAGAGVFAAILSERRGDLVEASVQLGAADRLRGTPDATSPDIARLTERLRAALDDVFDEHYERGRALGRDEAIAALDPARQPN